MKRHNIRTQTCRNGTDVLADKDGVIDLGFDIEWYNSAGKTTDADYVSAI